LEQSQFSFIFDESVTVLLLKCWLLC